MSALSKVQKYGFYILLSQPNEQGRMTAKIVDPTGCAVAEHKTPASLETLVAEARKYIEKIEKENRDGKAEYHENPE